MTRLAFKDAVSRFVSRRRVGISLAGISAMGVLGAWAPGADKLLKGGIPLTMIGTAAAAEKREPPRILQPLLNAPHWLNAPRPQASDLQGKVVLVNFWTFTCINSLRPLPYVKAWAEKYRGRGLVVVGAHTPEFEIEKEAANVQKAISDLGITYPVLTDNDYRVWRAFENNAWPSFYLIGADGQVKHKIVGEGDYARAEQWIQALLSDASGETVNDKIAAVAGEGPLAAPDFADLRSPETYVGYRQADGFASAGGFDRDRPHGYRRNARLSLNQWSLEGVWNVGEEFARLADAPGSINFRFHARDLHLVLAPVNGKPIRFRVALDGASPGEDHGTDTAADGSGVLNDARMYQLIRQRGPIRDRAFEIQFLDPGARAYVFTFG